MKEEEAEPAQTPATPTTGIVAVGSAVPAVTQIDKQPRPASSVYSRDIDGNLYRSASTVRDFSSRSASFENLLPPLISLKNSGESSNTSFVVSIDPDHLFQPRWKWSKMATKSTTRVSPTQTGKALSVLCQHLSTSQGLASVAAILVEAQPTPRKSQ